MERFSLISTILILLTGWPGIITSLAVSVAGIIRKNPAWLIAGAVFAVPFSWYLSQTPLFEHIGLFLAGIAVWLGVVVLTQ